MQTKTQFVALIAGSMLLMGSAFAQTPAPTKQPTQEGGGRTFLACGPEYNANPAGDPRAVSELIESRTWLGIGSACESVPVVPGRIHASRVFV